jgi:hypothetical protein
METPGKFAGKICQPFDPRARSSPRWGGSDHRASRTGHHPCGARRGASGSGDHGHARGNSGGSCSRLSATQGPSTNDELHVNACYATSVTEPGVIGAAWGGHAHCGRCDAPHRSSFVAPGSPITLTSVIYPG